MPIKHTYVFLYTGVKGQEFLANLVRRYLFFGMTTGEWVVLCTNASLVHAEMPYIVATL